MVHCRKLDIGLIITIEYTKELNKLDVNRKQIQKFMNFREYEF